MNLRGNLDGYEDGLDTGAHPTGKRLLSELGRPMRGLRRTLQIPAGRDAYSKGHF
jgi:hypothetical protein